MSVRRAIRQLLWRWGYDLRYQPQLRFSTIGLSLFDDAKRHIQTERPIIFDVGANVGQTIALMRRHWPESTIHSFEPGAATFTKLQANTRDVANLRLNQCALGSEPGEATFSIYDRSEANSLLPPGTASYGARVGTEAVRVRTLDEYCLEQGVNRLDLLKIDTQGYDLNVLRGATSILRNTNVVFVELIFSDVYADQPRYYELLRFLDECGFALGGIDGFEYRDSVADSADAMFVRRR